MENKKVIEGHRHVDIVRGVSHVHPMKSKRADKQIGSLSNHICKYSEVKTKWLSIEDVQKALTKPDLTNDNCK